MPSRRYIRYKRPVSTLNSDRDAMRSASHVGTSGSRPAAAVPPAALARHGGGVNLTQDADAQPQRW
jgi:hypothetical protein